MRSSLVLFFCLFATPGLAWNWQTHSALVDSAYYSLEDNVSTLLSLDHLRNGSLAPDRDFHDNRLHHYPPSYKKTVEWLEKAKTALAKEEYAQASYAFGVATHYVSDSFAAPHTVEKESATLHSAYEKQGDEAYLFVPCQEVVSVADLEGRLAEATKQRSTWEPWVATRNVEIPAKAVAASYQVVLPLALEVFGGECRAKTTTVAAADFLSFGWKEILLASVLLYGIFSLTFSLLRDAWLP